MASEITGDTGAAPTARRDAAPGRWLPIAALALIGGAAGASRFWWLGRKSIWLDEAWGWRATRIPAGDMLDWAAQSKDPPLYYLVLRAFVDVFGDSEIVLRAPSALASVLTIVILAWYCWRIGGPVLALATSAFLLLNSAGLQFAQEARMYPLVGLLAVLSAMALAEVIRRPDPLRFVLYGAPAVALVYTHYSGLVAVGAQAVVLAAYGVYRWRAERALRLLGGGIATFAAIGASYAPWAPNLFEHVSTGVGYIPPPSRAFVIDVMRSAAGFGAAGRWWWLLALPIAVSAGRGVFHRRRDERVVCAAALTTAPVALLFFSTVRSPIFDLRQVSPYIPALAFLAGVAIDDAVRTIREAREFTRSAATAALPAFLAVTALTMTRGVMDVYRTEGIEDWRAVAARAAPGTDIYVWRRYSAVPLSYYAGNGRTIIEISPPFEAAAASSAAVSSGGSALLVLSHQTDAEAQAITTAFAQYFRLREPASYRGIRVYEMRRR